MLAQQTIGSLPRRRRWLSLSVASLATLLVTADTGQPSIALPVIITEFNADLTLASWIALVYALITASLYLPCGRLSDLVGIGKVFSEEGATVLAAFLQGFHYTYLMAAVLCLVGAALSAIRVSER
jgi:MFS family permease